jgi:hypothetical protein
VAQAPTLLLATQTPWDDTIVADLVQQPAQWTIPDLTPQAVNLSIYDQLLQPEACYAAS